MDIRKKKVVDGQAHFQKNVVSFPLFSAYFYG